MPIYTYETIPQSPDEQPETFEIKQSMTEPALERHPETGKPVRRVITGGAGLITKGKTSTASAPAAPSCCGASCGCH